MGTAHRAVHVVIFLGTIVCAVEREGQFSGGHGCPFLRRVVFAIGNTKRRSARGRRRVTTEGRWQREAWCRGESGESSRASPSRCRVSFEIGNATRRCARRRRKGTTKARWHHEIWRRGRCGESSLASLSLMLTWDETAGSIPLPHPCRVSKFGLVRVAIPKRGRGLFSRLAQPVCDCGLAQCCRPNLDSRRRFGRGGVRCIY